MQLASTSIIIVGIILMVRRLTAVYSFSPLKTDIPEVPGMVSPYPRSLHCYTFHEPNPLSHFYSTLMYFGGVKGPVDFGQDFFGAIPLLELQLALNQKVRL
ncbi:unnamed protein product [Symbiodinium sp. KB8]|nr:unnamed protein product [Symbiodinium sp. KB8]